MEYYPGFKKREPIGLHAKWHIVFNPCSILLASGGAVLFFVPDAVFSPSLTLQVFLEIYHFYHSSQNQYFSFVCVSLFGVYFIFLLL
jgi:hypothetical protein